MATQNPQDPYQSFIVSASAGSGKTFQLSRRFLYLVASGAAANEILTITYTKKAAAEMKERILEFASELKSNKQLADEFDQQIIIFKKQNSINCNSRNAIQTANEILQSTQALKISTIDSIFMEWAKQYPYDASSNDKEALTKPFELITEELENTISLQAWQKTLEYILKEDHTQLLKQNPEEDPQKTFNLLIELNKQKTKIWGLLQKQQNIFIRHKEPLNLDLSNADDLFEYLNDDLKNLISNIKNDDKRDNILEALSQKSLQKLIQSKLLTTKNSINITTVGKKTVAEQGLLISTIEQNIKLHLNQNKSKKLNLRAKFLESYYKMFAKYYLDLKSQQDLIEYTDLTKFAFNIMTRDTSIGARYFLTRQIRHILLDEFQDTSRLQWQVFSAFIKEIAAGYGVQSTDNNLKGTIFLVGDPKQSIYRFRGADPEVMNIAQSEFADSTNIISLDKSYRTTTFLLDYFNIIFKKLEMHNYNMHSGASINSQAVTPNISRICVQKHLLACDKNEEITAVETEINILVKYISDCIAQKIPTPVYDKEHKIFRKLEHKDCMILFRSKTHCHLLEESLQQHNIPYNKADEGGFFNKQINLDLFALVKYICLPHDLISLLTVIKSSLLRSTSNLTAQELESYIIDALKQNSNSVINFLEQLISIISKSSKHTNKDSTVLTHLKNVPFDYSYASIVQKIIAILDYLKIAPNVATDFVEYLLSIKTDELNNSNSLVKRIDSDIELNKFKLSADNNNALSLMTIHKAKGLEFPFVCLFDCDRPWSKNDTLWLSNLEGLDSSNKEGLYFVGNKTEQPSEDQNFKKIIDYETQKNIEESNRLLYVALSRAKQYLFISGHQPKQKRGIAESCYLTLLQDSLHEYKVQNSFSNIDHEFYMGLENNELQSICLEKNISISTIRKNTSNLVKQNYKLNSNELYLSIQQLKKIVPSEIKPTAKIASKLETIAQNSYQKKHPSLYGTLIHKALENLVLNKATLLSNKYLKNLDLPYNIKQTQELSSLVVTAAKNAYNNKIFASLLDSSLHVETELDFSLKRDKEIVRGQIDLVLFLPNDEALIIDYKTQKFSLKANKSELKNFCISKGYNLHLDIYKHAVLNLYPSLITVDCAIYFTSSCIMIEL